MEGTGTYHDGKTARAQNCRVVLSADAIHLFFEGPDFIIWSLSAIESCHLNGNFLIIKYGSFPHQTLECNGEIAKAVYRSWAGRSVVRNAEGAAIRSGRTAVIVLIVSF